ncbi:MAG: TolB family protein, partial [Gammaproteobacteria bacterium]
MKSLFVALVFMSAAGSALAAPHPFTVHDLVMMDRVSDPQLAPNGSQVAFSVRETDYAANKGITSVWVLNLNVRGAEPQKLATGNSPGWSPDGKTLYFLSDKSGTDQLWRVAAAGGTPAQVSALPLAINNYRISPDGSHVLLSMDVFTDCKDIACTKARLDARAKDKATGRLYTHLFVRHWNQWMDGRRSQLFIAALGGDGKLEGNPIWLSKGLDGDVPSKPFGDNTEYGFAPDGKTIYFNTSVRFKCRIKSFGYPIGCSIRLNSWVAARPARRLIAGFSRKP